ncbi:MAG: M56 family metallopeptidase [Gemmatimonadota bacterium]
MSTVVLELLARSVLLLAPLLIALRLARRASAAGRHRLLAVGLVAHLVLALASVLPVPGWRLPIDTGEAPASVVMQDGGDAVATRGPVSGPAAPAAGGGGSPTSFVPALLPAIWLAGVVLLLARLAFAHRSVMGLVRRAVRSAAVGVPPAIRVVESGEVGSPFVYGVRRPVLVLPSDWSAWSPRVRRSALRHELAHIRRRDPFWSAVGELTAACFWPNPLVWVALRSLRLESKRAADDAVVSAGADPRRYVADLLGGAR